MSHGTYSIFVGPRVEESDQRPATDMLIGARCDFQRAGSGLLATGYWLLAIYLLLVTCCWLLVTVTLGIFFVFFSFFRFRGSGRPALAFLGPSSDDSARLRLRLRVTLGN